MWNKHSRMKCIRQRMNSRSVCSWRELRGVRVIESHNKIFICLRNSVIARVRNSASHFQSNLYSFRRGLLLIASVRKNGVSARRELTVTSKFLVDVVVRSAMKFSRHSDRILSRSQEFIRFFHVLKAISSIFIRCAFESRNFTIRLYYWEMSRAFYKLEAF